MKISNILRENCIIVSGLNCNTTFRNLMATFRDNVQRAINPEKVLLIENIIF